MTGRRSDASCTSFRRRPESSSGAFGYRNNGLTVVLPTLITKKRIKGIATIAMHRYWIPACAGMTSEEWRHERLAGTGIMNRAKPIQPYRRL